MEITIYTDGACTGNPGPGGWAAIILLKNENLSFNVTKAKKFIDGYSSIRRLNESEKISLKILCRGAAIRFLLTRVFDYLNLTEGALVKIKDPIEYLKRLEFHNSVTNYQDYFF